MKKYLNKQACLKWVVTFFFFFLGGMINHSVVAQCTNSSHSGGTVAAPTSSTPITVSTCTRQTEFDIITTARAGNTYRSTNSLGGYITVRTTFDDFVAAGPSPLTWIATDAPANQFFIHYTVNSSCVTANNCGTTTISCLDFTCYSTFINATITAPSTLSPVTISTCAQQRQFDRIQNAVVGNTYRSSHATPGCYITIRQGSLSGALVAKGTTPVTWTASVTDDHYVHYNTNSSCGTSSACSTSTIICTNCACTNSTANGTVSAPLTSTPSIINACTTQEEYSTITAVQSGNTYLLNYSLGGYISVRQGSYNGAVVCNGVAPLSWTATTSGTFYIHYNTNDGCGTAANCGTSEIICSSCGCENTIEHSSLNAPVNSGPISISGCVTQSQYTTINNVTLGGVYRSQHSLGGYVIVRGGSPNGTLISKGTSPLTWTATGAAGTFYVHYTNDSLCSTASTCGTATISCLSCPCANVISNGSYNAPLSNFTDTISTCMKQQEYAEINNMVAGGGYRFEYSLGGYIVIRQNTHDGAIVAQGSSPLTYSPTSSGTYYVHYFTNASCGNSSACGTATMRCTICGCINSTSNGTISAPTDLTVLTISNCFKQDEYVMVTNAMAGKTYQINYNLPGYCSIRQGTYDGINVTRGSFPLSWTAPTSGDYFIHITTNASCGTASTCGTATITCNSCICENTIANATIASPIDLTPITVSNCSSQDKYDIISYTPPGSTYLSTYDLGGYLTIRLNSPNGTIVAHGPAPLSWTPTAAGLNDYYIHYNTNSFCGTASTCGTSTITCTSCFCTNSTQSATVNAPTNLLPVTISSCTNRNSYVRIDNVVAGNNYLSELSLDSYINIHQGTYNGQVIAQGSSPLTWTPTVSGTYFVHYNTNMSCSTSTSCATSKITCTSCPSVGCINTSYNATASAPATNIASITISTCTSKSEYDYITGIAAGETYISTHSNGGYISVNNQSNVIVAHGNSPLTWTAATAGNYSINYTLNSGCATSSSCGTSTISCSTCPAGCVNSTHGTTVNAPTNTTSLTIMICNFPGEYTTINGCVPGKTYTSTNTAGGFITVSQNTPNGTIVNSGNSPLTWTAPSSGTYYVHYNTSNNCGVNTTCGTTSITCTNCNITSLYSYEESERSTISLKPNPTNSSVTIELNMKGVLELYNSKGQLVWKEEVSKGEFVKDVKQFIAGLYSVKFTTEKGISTTRLIISE